MVQPRLAVRAVIVQDGALLLVNAYPGGASDLWCAPGGGVVSGLSLAENLVREVHEETGLIVLPGPLAHVGEFHDPDHAFHQVDLYFTATLAAGRLDPAWRDPEGVVDRRAFFPAQALAGLRIKPDILPRLAFAPGPGIMPGALERQAR